MDAKETNAAEINVKKLSLIEFREYFSHLDDTEGWYYCDCPSNTPASNNDPTDFYAIKHNNRQIGFVIIREGFEYFKEQQGTSIGLDIPVSDARGHGCGTIALKKTLQIAKNAGLHKIYLETLSYNTPMRHVAEKLGFTLLEPIDPGDSYQTGYINHIGKIASCLNKTEDELRKETPIKALLYELDLDNWAMLN